MATCWVPDLTNIEAFLKVSTVTLVLANVFFVSRWPVYKRSEHENYLSTNILKTHLCRLQHAMNLFVFFIFWQIMQALWQIL